MKKKYLVLQIKKDKRPEKIYEILTDKFFYEDIFLYSEGEYFIDITNYEELYQKTDYKIAQELKNTLTKEKYSSIKIGIGTNLFLAKTACDIVTKRKKIIIAFLDEKKYFTFLSTYKPLSDFWQISNSMMLKLKSLGIDTMEDIRNYSYKKLYEIFGKNAEYLINHSLGLECTTIKELRKTKTPKRVSSTTTFKTIKSTKESIQELIPLLDFNILKLKEENLKTKTIYLYIKYANNIIPKQTIPIKLSKATDSYNALMKTTLSVYKEKINPFFPIEKLAISFGEITKRKEETLSILLPKKRKNYLFAKIFFRSKKQSITASNQMNYLHT